MVLQFVYMIARVDRRDRLHLVGSVHTVHTQTQCDSRNTSRDGPATGRRRHGPEENHAPSHRSEYHRRAYDREQVDESLNSWDRCFGPVRRDGDGDGDGARDGDGDGDMNMDVEGTGKEMEMQMGSIYLVLI